MVSAWNVWSSPILARASDVDSNVQRRRWIVGLSVVGLASMVAVSLLQTGLLKHLPDPPIRGFDSDKVDLSPTAFPFGIPDGTLAAVSFALDLPLAGYGGADRARAHPLVPLLAAAKAALDAAVAARYFYQMPTREHAWCVYCVVGALADFAIFGLTLPEAKEALKERF